MSTWDNKAINGKDLQEQVVLNLASEIKKRGLAEVIAEALVNLDARMKAVENAVNEENIGERISDSLDAQVLKIGGVDAVNSVKAVSGSDVAIPGTPRVDVSIDGNEATLTFHKLKGSPGNNGTNGVGVSSVTMNYAASSSGTTAPTTGWQTSVPSVSGQYLWSRADILLTNNTHQYIYSVSFVPVVINVVALSYIPASPIVGTLYAL